VGETAPSQSSPPDAATALQPIASMPLRAIVYYLFYLYPLPPVIAIT